MYTTILVFHTLVCGLGTMLAGQAEYLSMGRLTVFSVDYARFLPTSSDTAAPEPLPPSPDVGFEFEVLTLEVLLRGCSHDVHVCYLFNPLLSQDMEIETLCPERAV